jgi:hypothetical protein
MLVSYPQDGFLESHRFLLLYAHAIAFIHGVGFLAQGSTRMDGLIKYALLEQDAWHGGLPALSLFPVSFMAGLMTVLLTIMSTILILRPPLFSWYRILPLMIFLTGGGFVFFYISLLTTISLLIRPKHEKSHSTVGKWLIIMLLGWFFLSWILGWAIPSFMLAISFMTFIFFDLMLPLAIVLTNHLPDWLSNRKR